MSEQIRINDLEGSPRYVTLADVDWEDRLIALDDSGKLLIFNADDGLSIEYSGFGVEGRYWIAKSQYDVVVRLVREFLERNNARAKYRNQFDPLEPADEDQEFDYERLLQDAMSD